MSSSAMTWQSRASSNWSTPSSASLITPARRWCSSPSVNSTEGW